MTGTAGGLNPLDEQAIEELVTQATSAIAHTETLDELKAVRLEFMGDSAALVQANRGIGQLDPKDRGVAGRLLGGARSRITQALDERQELLQERHDAQVLVSEAVDVTIPTARERQGARHPLETIMEEISDFFVGMGWQIAEGPEIEHEWFNFDSLNFDIDHPARQMQDTLYIDGRSVGGENEEDGHLVMRTHTSPVQSRSILSRGVPLFTEPSAEMDLWFPQKKGGAGWIEWGGCGMVNPNVLRATGVDPEVYTGIAFGVGVERTLMLRDGIADMHDIVEGDVRFSEQFGVNGLGRGN